MTTVVFVIWFLGQGSPKPFVSVTNVAAAQVAHGLPVLRKRHETDRAEGFSSIGITVNPFSMSARGKCSETCLYPNACSYTEVRVEKQLLKDIFPGRLSMKCLLLLWSLLMWIESKFRLRCILLRSPRSIQPFKIT